MMRGRTIAALCALAWLGIIGAPAMAQTGGGSCEQQQRVQNGQLRCTFADGRTFNGVVRNGEANGQGEMTFPNGDRYAGQFVNGFFGGRGTYWYNSGARYDGDFANGVRHGQGATVWPNGARYTGSYRNNLPDGYGTVWSSGETHSGTWASGCLASARIAIDKSLADCGYR